MKVYLEEFPVNFEGEIIMYAYMKEAVSNALLIAAPIDICIDIIKKRDYDLVDKEIFAETEEYAQDKTIDLLVHTLITSNQKYH